MVEDILASPTIYEKHVDFLQGLVARHNDISVYDCMPFINEGILNLVSPARQHFRCINIVAKICHLQVVQTLKENVHLFTGSEDPVKREDENGMVISIPYRRICSMT